MAFAPNTPQLELDSQGSPFANPPSSSSAVSPVKTDFSNLTHRDSISHQPHTSVSTSYPSQSYPSGPNSTSTRTPLLESAFDNDPSVHHKRASEGSLRGRSGRGAGWLTSRARLHPVLLVPAFLVGALMAMSGLFGTGWSGQARMYWSSSEDLAGAQPDYTIHQSGHLFLNPTNIQPAGSAPYAGANRGVRHPILDLIANATQNWENKLARQSKTLEEAVREYRRRHKRNPPKGFDKWFAFAQENEVVLIDEFDATFRDVLPFLALPPELILERADELREDPNTFTAVVRGGELEVVGAHKDEERAKKQGDLMRRWVEHMDDFNMTMSAHDGPSVITNHRVKIRHIAAALAGKVLTREEADDPENDASYWGFPLSCPPGSRLRRAAAGLETATLPPGPSFISNHIQSMDLCANPEWQYLHGFTAWPGAPPQVLRLLFSYSKTHHHSDLLLPPLEQYGDYEPTDPAWEKKKHNRAVWRGSTTGVWFDRGTWWRSSQRVRMYFLTRDTVGERLVRFVRQAGEGVGRIVEEAVSTRSLARRYVSFGFAGQPTQCSIGDGSCAAVEEAIKFEPGLTWNEANEYKYMLDLDGNAWSGRFHRLLQSNSVVLESTIFPEWYAEWIVPWVHYIPLKVDYTDLWDIMAFFSGDMHGRHGHDHLAKQVAEQGKEYAARHWRYADMEAYFFRLAIEWARCSSMDRENMDYTGPGTED